jgi:hypothetical protein
VKLHVSDDNPAVDPIDAVVAEEAARIRGVCKLKTPDAIIAETIVVHKTDLLLRNRYLRSSPQRGRIIVPGRNRSIIAGSLAGSQDIHCRPDAVGAARYDAAGVTAALADNIEVFKTGATAVFFAQDLDGR